MGRLLESRFGGLNGCSAVIVSVMGICTESETHWGVKKTQVLLVLFTEERKLKSPVKQSIETWSLHLQCWILEMRLFS